MRLFFKKTERHLEKEKSGISGVSGNKRSSEILAALAHGEKVYSFLRSQTPRKNEHQG
jgi:hypothetical protein